MNKIDKAVEEEIRKCALNDTVPSIFSDTTETEEEQNTSKSEDSLSEEQEKCWKEFTEKMKKVVYMGELQKDHTERCTGAKLIKI